MNDFSELRRLAREKRDEAIKAARLEYQVTLEEINALQKRLTKKPSQKGKPKPIVPLRVLILDVAPHDSTWTVSEVTKRLERPETDENLIRATLSKMLKKGDIKRIRRGRNNIPALFAVKDYGPADAGLNGLSQIEAAEIVLRQLGRPVSLTQLVVEMLEQGYEPVTDERTLRRSLGSAMVRKTGFVDTSGLWSVGSNYIDKIP